MQAIQILRAGYSSVRSKPYTVKAALETATQRLIRAGCDTPRLDSELIVAHVLGKERTWLYMQPQASLKPAQKKRFFELIRRREQREPVAYITGFKEFFALEFLVNKHVLLPRPETELLVEKVRELALTKFLSSIFIADVGTGSGCIAVTLAKHIATARITAIDISPQAIQVARHNAVRHDVANNIGFVQGDLLGSCRGPFDIIVGNPPYIGRNELAATPPEVHRYEPRLALDGGHDGLAIIEQLLAQAKEVLKPVGCCLIEIGATQGPAVKRLAQGHFPTANIFVQQDLAGLDRLLIIEHSAV